MFKREDFMSVVEVAKEFGCSTETIRRWIRKGHAEPSQVEVHGGQYYVTKELVQIWKNALDGRPPMRGRPVHVGGFRKTTPEEDEQWLSSQGL